MAKWLTDNAEVPGIPGGPARDEPGAVRCRPHPPPSPSRQQLRFLQPSQEARSTAPETRRLVGMAKSPKLRLATLIKARGGYVFRQTAGLQVRVSLARSCDAVMVSRLALWSLDKGARASVPTARLAEYQPFALARLQPGGKFPPGVPVSDAPTGDSRIDEALSYLAAGHGRLARHELSSSTRRPVDDRASSRSVRTVPGGAAEQNRRRH